MTRPNRFDNEEGIIIHGKAYTRSQVLGVKCKCYLALRQSQLPPHALEKYDSTKSSNGVVIVLKNVIVNPSGKRGFDLISSGGVIHHFTVDSEALAAQWIKNLHDLTSFEPLDSGELYSDVVPHGLSLNLLPSTVLDFHGRCYLVASEQDICLHEMEDSSRIVVSWPLKAIRAYGIRKNMFTLKTGRSTVTGRAEFIFEVSKPLTPFHVYQEVAAKVFNSLTVAKGSNHLPADEIEPSTEKDISTDETGGFDSYEQSSVEGLSSPVYETLPDGDLDEPCATPKRHEESVDEPAKVTVYTRLPLVHSVTCQLPSKSFPSVFGLDECVTTLKTLLRRESCFRNCSVLFYGPPGSGKKTLANALAMEIEARFACLDCAALVRKLGLDDLENLRETLECILTLRPCVVLLEHIDVIPGGFQDSRLGFAVLKAIRDFLGRAVSNPQLVITCATAFPQSVHGSLLTWLSEPIYVPLPSEMTRSYILKNKLKFSALSEAEEFVRTLALRTSGYSVAELLELCNEAEHAMKRSCSAQLTVTEKYQQLETILARWTLDHLVPITRAESIEPSARYFARRRNVQDTFFVTLESNAALPDVNSCFLRVTSSGLELLDLDPAHLIISWSRKTIRGFGTAVNLFQLETGRSSCTGEAFFNFKTNEASEIQQMIEKICSNQRNPSESSTPTLEHVHVV